MENVGHCDIDTNVTDGRGQTGLDRAKYREKRIKRLIRGRDNLFWKLVDFFITIHEICPQLTLGLILILMFTILQRVWGWIRLNLTDCDMDCYYFYKHSIVFTDD